MPRWLTLLLVLMPLHAAGLDRRIAITMDDLPWAHLAEGDPVVPPEHADLIDAIRRERAPITGFVNESKLEIDGQLQPARVQMLRDWLDAGAGLGNHTFGHLDLHAVGLERYGADVLRGERTLRPLLAERGETPKWFRHPYLRAGRSQADKQALTEFLAKHGYRVAPVTVDNSDWAWADAYRNAGSEALRAKLRDDYVPHMLQKIDYYERQSLDLLGYNPPHVWLMHANALNAATYSALLAGARARGYAIVTLDEALRDKAYRREDGYTGPYGPSWIHRWAAAEGKPVGRYAGEPPTPQWVLDLASAGSE